MLRGVTTRGRRDARAALAGGMVLVALVGTALPAAADSAADEPALSSSPASLAEPSAAPSVSPSPVADVPDEGSIAAESTNVDVEAVDASAADAGSNPTQPDADAPSPTASPTPSPEPAAALADDAADFDVYTGTAAPDGADPLAETPEEYDNPDGVVTPAPDVASTEMRGRGAADGSNAVGWTPTSGGGFNPFDINGGFTVYTTGDAFFNGDEIEGSIAAGGTIDSIKKYDVIHHNSGDGSYDLPSVDGQATRVLVNRLPDEKDALGGWFDVSSTGAGTPGAAGVGVVKVVNMQIGDFAVNHVGGATEQAQYQLDSGQSDSVPRIDARHQIVSDASSHDAWVSSFQSVKRATSIQEGARVVARYVEAQATKTSAEMSSCLAAFRDPARSQDGQDVSRVTPIAGDFGANDPDVRLTAGAVNVIEYADIEGNFQYRNALHFGPKDNATAPGPTTPVIIHVSPEDVSNGAVIRPTRLMVGDQVQPEAARYVMWDFSDIHGDVIMSADVEIDGAMYAPFAHLTIEGNHHPVNGQVFAREFTSAKDSGEIHHYGFEGTFKCPAEHTSNVEKHVYDVGAQPVDRITIDGVKTRGNKRELAAAHLYRVKGALPSDSVAWSTIGLGDLEAVDSRKVPADNQPHDVTFDAVDVPGHYVVVTEWNGSASVLDGSSSIDDSDERFTVVKPTATHASQIQGATEVAPGDTVTDSVTIANIPSGHEGTADVDVYGPYADQPSDAAVPAGASVAIDGLTVTADNSAHKVSFDAPVDEGWYVVVTGFPGDATVNGVTSAFNDKAEMFHVVKPTASHASQIQGAAEVAPGTTVTDEITIGGLPQSFVSQYAGKGGFKADVDVYGPYADQPSDATVPSGESVAIDGLTVAADNRAHDVDFEAPVDEGWYVVVTDFKGNDSVNGVTSAFNDTAEMFKVAAPNPVATTEARSSSSAAPASLWDQITVTDGRAGMTVHSVLYYAESEKEMDKGNRRVAWESQVDHDLAAGATFETPKYVATLGGVYQWVAVVLDAQGNELFRGDMDDAKERIILSDAQFNLPAAGGQGTMRWLGWGGLLAVAAAGGLYVLADRRRRA